MSEIISYFKYKFIFSNDNKENINEAQIYKDNKENIIIMNNEDNKDAFKYFWTQITNFIDK